MTSRSGFCPCFCQFCGGAGIFFRALNNCGLTSIAKFDTRKEYDIEGWDSFSMATEPILRRTLRRRRYTSVVETQPLIASGVSSDGTGNENEMEHSSYVPVMQSTTSKSDQAESLFHDDMENSRGTSDPQSTPRLSQQEIDYLERRAKKSLDMYHQSQMEEREWEETDLLMDEDREIKNEELSKGDLTQEGISDITSQFNVGDKVIFKVDLSDCDVQKGDCGEVVELMELGSVVVRTNNLAMEVKVDHIYLKQATVYQVEFITGICGFGVVPGLRNKNAYVGPTLQSESARRAVLSGSQIMKVNNLNVALGYNCREIKQLIKTSKRPIRITFKWDEERAEAMVSQKAPY